MNEFLMGMGVVALIVIAFLFVYGVIFLFLIIFKHGRQIDSIREMHNSEIKCTNNDIVQIRARLNALESQDKGSK